MRTSARWLGTCWLVLVAGVMGCAEGRVPAPDAGLGSVPAEPPVAIDASVPCACSVGECCDGCNLRPASSLCGASPVAVEFACDGAACGADALFREQYQYCDGSSAECGQENLIWHEWELSEDCGSDALCQSDGDSASCFECASGCSDGACTCSQGANVATTALASINRGSSAPATYGPQLMNDGNGEGSCGFSWFYDTSPDIGWMELEWSTPQVLWGFAVDTVSSSYAPCAYTTGRTLGGGTVQWWDGGAWVNDGVVSGQTGDWSYEFTSPVTTTRVRIYSAYGSPSSNPVVFEWQAFTCGN